MVPLVLAQAKRSGPFANWQGRTHEVEDDQTNRLLGKLGYALRFVDVVSEFSDSAMHLRLVRCDN